MTATARRPWRRVPTRPLRRLIVASRQEIALTQGLPRFTIITPMARNLTAETSLQGQALSGFGAYACQSGLGLEHEAKPGRRESANTGSPVVRR